MTQLFRPPLAVGVQLSAEGAPALVDGPFEGRLQPVLRWMAELDWWRQPIAREYWKVFLNEEVLCELFHDLYLDAWFLERIWD